MTVNNTASKKEKTASKQKAVNLDLKLSNSPKTISESDNFDVRQVAGNLTLQRLLSSGEIQAKLTISAPGDKYEQEADRVADLVVRMRDPRLQRQPDNEEEEEEPELRRQPVNEEEEEKEEEIVQSKPLAHPETSWLQRQPAEEEAEFLQTKRATGSVPKATLGLASRINSLSGGGGPLPRSERAFFEPRFGADFSRVRLHTDRRADALAQALKARAFTQGHDIFFAAGQFVPNASGGKRLLAHELTHVAQQRGQRKPMVHQSDRSPQPQISSVRTSSIVQQKEDIWLPGVVQVPEQKAELPWGLASSALKSSDPEPARKIKRFGDLSSATRLQLISLFIECGVESDARHIERIWASFGDGLFRVASTNTALWKESADFGAKLGEIDAVKNISQNFKKDVKDAAQKQLKKNEGIILDELDKLGIILGCSPWAEYIDPQHRYYMDRPDRQQAKYLAKIRADAAEVLGLREALRLLRSLNVGWKKIPEPRGELIEPGPGSAQQAAEYRRKVEEYASARQYGGYLPVSFSPEKEPPYPFSKVPQELRPKKGFRSWKDVNEKWGETTKRISKIASASPLIYTLLEGESLAKVMQGDSARQTLAETALKVLKSIDETSADIKSDGLDYRYLTPIHEKLMAGTIKGASGTEWSDPVPRLIAQSIIEEYRRSKEAKKFLLGLLGIALAIITIGQSGWTLAAILAFDTVLAGGIAAVEWEHYLDLAQASGASVSEQDRVVKKADVEIAKEEATLSTVIFFLSAAVAAGQSLRTIRNAKAVRDAIREGIAAEESARVAKQTKPGLKPSKAPPEKAPPKGKKRGKVREAEPGLEKYRKDVPTRPRGRKLPKAKGRAPEAKAPPPEAKAPPARPYDDLDLPSLQKAARTDREAAEALWQRYQSESDFELFRRFIDDADETAGAVIRQRYPSNEAALRRVLGSNYRPPHSADVLLRRGGKEVSRQKLVSGNMTPEEKALGFPKNMLATHTEARAVKQLDLKPRDFLEIRGQYDPCGSCRRAMQNAANETGATIRYWWQGGSETFSPGKI